MKYRASINIILSAMSLIGLTTCNKRPIKSKLFHEVVWVHPDLQRAPVEISKESLSRTFSVELSDVQGGGYLLKKNGCELWLSKDAQTSEQLETDLGAGSFKKWTQLIGLEAGKTTVEIGKTTFSTAFFSMDGKIIAIGEERYRPILAVPNNGWRYFGRVWDVEADQTWGIHGNFNQFSDIIDMIDMLIPIKK